jgi:hypothetical protein
MPSMLVWKKFVSSVCSQEMTAWFMSVCRKSISSWVFLKWPKRTDIPEPCTANQTCKWIQCYDWGGYTQPPYSSDVTPRPFPPFFTLPVTPGCRVICNRHQQQANCHLLATGTSHLFSYAGTKAFGSLWDKCAYVNSDYMMV